MSGSSQLSGVKIDPAKFIIKKEPPRMLRTDVDDILYWTATNEASDTRFQTGQPIKAEIQGLKWQITRRSLTQPEVEEVAVRLFGAESARTEIKGGKDLDGAYEYRYERGKKFRFRFNVTAIQEDGSDGIQITCRTIPSDPPLLANMKVEKDILNNLSPRQGIIVVAGATGSGKTTLLASIIRELLEQPDGHRTILTYESPIEFTYDNIEKPSSIIAQSEVPRHLKSFTEGIRNALRRKPDIILLGEARDAETIGESITAAQTGHLVYTTTHTNGVAETIRRMVNAFPAAERSSRATDLITSLNMIIGQTLLRTVDGKRVAIREFLIFTRDIQEELLEANVDNVTLVLRRILQTQGQTFLQDARAKYQQGIIPASELAKIEEMYRGSNRDAKQAKSLIMRQAELVGLPANMKATPNNRGLGSEELEFLG